LKQLKPFLKQIKSLADQQGFLFAWHKTQYFFEKWCQKYKILQKSGAKNIDNALKLA